MENKPITIWFFIGSLFSVYGILILATGIYATFFPDKDAVVLSNLHIAIWWGAGMLVMGFTFVLRFWPRARDDG
jgi:hypothetical protein